MYLTEIDDGCGMAKLGRGPGQVADVPAVTAGKQSNVHGKIRNKSWA
jgi:hypothetical protein